MYIDVMAGYASCDGDKLYISFISVIFTVTNTDPNTNTNTDPNTKLTLIRNHSAFCRLTNYTDT